MTRVIALILAMAGLAGRECEGSKMDEQLCPPWEMTSDETVVTNSARFNVCNQVLREMAASAKGKITERGYSVSKHWGLVVRARVVAELGTVSNTSFMICWSKSGSGVEIAVMPEPLRP